MAKNKNTITIVLIVLALLFLLKGCDFNSQDDRPSSIGLKLYDENGNLIDSVGDVGDGGFSVGPGPFATITVAGNTFENVKWIEFFVTLQNIGLEDLDDVQIVTGSVNPSPPPGGQDFSILMDSYTKIIPLLAGNSDIWLSDGDAGCPGIAQTNCALDIEGYVVPGQVTDYTFTVTGQGRDQSNNNIQAVGSLIAMISEDSIGDLFLDLDIGLASTLKYFPTDSNWVDENTPDTILPPNAAKMRTSFNTNQDKQFAYYKFDLTSLAGGSFIQKADLIYKTSSPNMPNAQQVRIWDVETTWDEDTVTWNTQPAMNNQLTIVSLDLEETWYATDVTSYVQSAFNTHKTPSLGFIPPAGSGSNRWWIHTEESPGNEPYLEITLG